MLSGEQPSHSESALQRRRIFRQAQEGIKRKQTRALQRQRVKKGFATVGKVIQTINIGKWIEDLERDQILADELDRINTENQQEQESKEICRQAEAACMQAVREHLDSFLQENPAAEYETWIRELHPDNVNVKDRSIDPRFYVEDSDHRILWNDTIDGDDKRIVPARRIVVEEEASLAQRV
jgi:hypothetical protein